MRWCFALVFAFCSYTAFADDSIAEFLKGVDDKTYSAAELAAAAEDYDIPLGQILAPVADYQPVGLLAMEASTPYDSLGLRTTVAQHTPAGVPVIVYGPKRELKDTADVFAEIVTRAIEDLTYARVDDPLGRDSGYEEWTADHLGYPVWIKGHGDKPRVGFVTAQYRWGYDPNPEFSRLLLSPIFYEIRDFIEFGNMVINAKRKTAYVVQSARLRNVPSEVYLATGVTRVVRLPHITRLDEAGSPYNVSIGHADERILFLSDDVVVVDTPEFAAFMRQEGYTVLQVPMFSGYKFQYRTYVNARLVNGTAFVPVFNDPMDTQALEVYRAAGFTPVPVYAPQTSDIGRGSVHCLTRTLPALPDGARYELLPATVEGAY